MPKPKIKIITERKIIAVQPGWLLGSSDVLGVEVDVCTTCAAIVFSPVAHDIWHTKNRKGELAD